MNFEIDEITKNGASFETDESVDLERRRIYRGDPLDAKVVSTGENPEDTSAHPGTEYEYRAVGSETTEWLSVETVSLGIPHNKIESAGWDIKLTHPETEQVVKPSLVGEPERVPKVNELPRVYVPIAKDASWLDSSWEGADMQVWYNGREQPIDELYRVKDREDRTQLIGRGGVDLLTRIRETIIEDPNHVAFEDFVEEYTDYEANVDEPQTSGEAGVTLQEGNDTTTWEDLKDELPDTAPVIVEDGTLKGAQTCFTVEGEDRDRDDGGTLYQDPDWSGNVGYGIDDSGQVVEWDFELRHTIPEDEFGVHIRSGDVDDVAGFDIIVELEDGTEETIDFLEGGEGTSLGWRDHAQNPFNEDGWTSGDVPPGEHTIRVEGTASGTEFVIDVIAPADNRFSYDFDNEVNEDGGYLDGPELYPDAAEIELPTVSPSLSIASVDLTSEWNNTDNNQQVALSTDQGGEYQDTANNSETISASYDPSVATIRVRLTFSRWDDGERDETPRLGYNGQEIDDYLLTADLDDTPIVVNQNYDNDAKDVLRQIAEDAGAFWEFRREAGTDSIEYTSPGQRTNDTDAEYVDYELEKDGTTVVKKVTVYGGRIAVSGEEFEADDDAVDLEETDIIEGTETVRDPDSGERFFIGTDYELDGTEGTIRRTGGSNLDEGETYEISYDHRSRGVYEAPDYDEDEDREAIETISSIVNTRAAELAARRIEATLETPQIRGRATISEAPPSWSVIEAISADKITDRVDTLQLEEIDSQEGNTTIILGVRQTLEDIIADINRRNNTLSRRV